MRKLRSLFKPQLADLPYSANYDYQKLHSCIKAAEKFQNHNTRLLKIIIRTENKLSAIAKEIARKAREVNKK